MQCMVQQMMVLKIYVMFILSTLLHTKDAHAYIILQNFMRTLYVITEKLLCTLEVHIYSTPRVPNNFP